MSRGLESAFALFELANYALIFESCSDADELPELILGKKVSRSNDFYCILP